MYDLAHAFRSLLYHATKKGILINIPARDPTYKLTELAISMLVADNYCEAEVKKWRFYC